MKTNGLGLTRASTVYESIRNDIMNGKIRPGDKLLFDVLREKYDIGISPLREALNRLDSEGWVTREERKGFRAAGTSEEELRQIVKARVLTEGAAIQSALRNNDVTAEENLVLTFHRLSKERRLSDGKRSTRWEKLHKDFHLCLVAGAHLPQVTAFCSQLFDKAERYRVLCASTYPERDERDEHAEITAAYVNGDADRTIALLQAHYQVTLDMIVKAAFN